MKLQGGCVTLAFTAYKGGTHPTLLFSDRWNRNFLIEMTQARIFLLGNLRHLVGLHFKKLLLEKGFPALRAEFGNRGGGADSIKV